MLILILWMPALAVKVVFETNHWTMPYSWASQGWTGRCRMRSWKSMC